MVADTLVAGGRRRVHSSAAHSDEEIDRIIELFESVVAQGHGKKAVNA